MEYISFRSSLRTCKSWVKRTRFDAICSCWRQTTQHQQHRSLLSRGNLNNNEKHLATGAGQIRLCCASSPCEPKHPSAAVAGWKNGGPSVVINITCMFIHLSGKKMHTVNNSFRHPVSQWRIINNVQRHWKYVEVYAVCPAGALPEVWGPRVIRGLLSSARMHHGNSYICSHYNSANKHSCSRNIHAQCFRFDLTHIQYKLSSKGKTNSISYHH